MCKFVRNARIIKAKDKSFTHSNKIYSNPTRYTENI